MLTRSRIEYSASDSIVVHIYRGDWTGSGYSREESTEECLTWSWQCLCLPIEFLLVIY